MHQEPLTAVLHQELEAADPARDDGTPQLMASSSTMPNDARLHGVQNTDPDDEVVRAAAVQAPGEVHERCELFADLASVQLAQRAVADDDEPHLVAALAVQEPERLDHGVEAVSGVEPAAEDDVLVVAHELGDRLGVGREVVGVDAVRDHVVGVRVVRRERADAGLAARRCGRRGARSRAASTRPGCPCPSSAGTRCGTSPRRSSRPGTGRSPRPGTAGCREHVRGRRRSHARGRAPAAAGRAGGRRCAGSGRCCPSRGRRGGSRCPSARSRSSAPAPRARRRRPAASAAGGR